MENKEEDKTENEENIMPLDVIGKGRRSNWTPEQTRRIRNTIARARTRARKLGWN